MKNPGKIATLVLILYPILLIFGFLIMVDFNKYYQFLISKSNPSSYYLLSDFNDRISAIADFNNDGEEDVITPEGCAYFNSTDTYTDINNVNANLCKPYNLKNIPTSRDEIMANDTPHHSYMIKENNLWYILVLDNQFQFSKYEIQNNGTFSKISPSALDFIHELIYVIPAFLFITPIALAFYLFSIFNNWILLLYIIILIISMYFWRQIELSNKEKGRRTHPKTK